MTAYDPDNIFAKILRGEIPSTRVYEDEHTIAFMDALKIQKPILAGFDWGARTANIIAALWPERCKAMVSVSGYLIGSQESPRAHHQADLFDL